MKVELINADALHASHIAAWAAAHRATPLLDSPFFSPRFTQAVAAVRDDVEVAVLNDEGAPVGFLPFHRNSRNIGRAVAYDISDRHGVVVKPGTDWDAGQLLRETGLTAWHYFSVMADDPAYRRFNYSLDHCPFMDLRDGFDAYCAQRKQAGSSLLSQAMRKDRKLQREVGPVRFELHTREPEAFDLLLRCKAQQYRDTGYHDVFRFDWVIDLLRSLQETESDDFAGAMSALWAGDKVIAVHLGVRTDRVLDWWFPTYDREYARYSPGLILLTRMAEACAERGIGRIDLGPGPERYKASFASGYTPLAKGAVDVRLVAGAIRKTRVRMRDYARSLPIKDYARRLLKAQPPHASQAPTRATA